MPEPFSYLTPAAAISSGLKEQGSRFIAHLSPVCEADEAMTVLQSLRRSYHDATHHCWAYRLGWGDGLLSRSSDDGEPSHTAGEPILRAMEDHGVSDAILVVVRYFGGVKLGTGGLTRAYRSAARQTLEAAHHRVRILVETWSVTLPYGAQGSFRHAAAESGVELSEQSFGEDLTLLARVPKSAAEPFLNRLERLSEQWKGAVRWKLK